MNKKKQLSIVLSGLISLASFQYADAQKKDGWVNLFDGKTLTGWKAVAGKATFAVEDNAIVGTTVANTGNTFLITEKTYSDFILEVDIKVEDTAGNSGVQTRSHYDAQGNNGNGKVFGRQLEVDPTKRKWTGGIYDEGRREWLYAMDLHASAGSAYKEEQYNHFTVECIGNEMKTWVNGVSAAYVVDTIDTEGFIGLQVHAISNASHAGKKVFFKNIRIKTGNLQPGSFAKGIYVANLSSNLLTGYEKKDGWKLLFDGQSSKGWTGAKNDKFPERGWQIKDGTITVLSSEGKESTNGGDIVTTELYSAFDLAFDFKFTPGANSGVKYFVTLQEASTGSAIGLEYQVLDDTLHPDAKLGRNGNRTLASLYDLMKAEKQKRFIRQPGQWNRGRVIVYPDNKVEHYLNGVKVLEYVRGSQQFRELVAQSKYAVWPNFGEAKSGRILLQDHGNEVSFKNIKIKSL